MKSLYFKKVPIVLVGGSALASIVGFIYGVAGGAMATWAYFALAGGLLLLAGAIYDQFGKVGDMPDWLQSIPLWLLAGSMTLAMVVRGSWALWFGLGLALTAGLCEAAWWLGDKTDSGWVDKVGDLGYTLRRLLIVATFGFGLLWLSCAAFPWQVMLPMLFGQLAVGALLLFYRLDEFVNWLEV